MLGGELQHLHRRAGAQVRLEEGEGEQERGGGDRLSFTSTNSIYIYRQVEVAFEDPDTGDIIRETVEVVSRPCDQGGL